MSVRDTDIADWSTTAADNAPADGTLIGRDLADQFRNIKSITRSESLAKEWIRLADYGTTSSVSGNVATITFESAAGDLTSYYTNTRKVRMVPASGSGAIYGGVNSSAYAFGVTVVVVNVLDGAPTNATEYVMSVGTENPSGSHLPAYGQSGNLTISGASTSGTFSFSRTEADTSYFIKTTIVSTNSAVTGAATVISTTKNAANCVIGLAAAPGGATRTVIGVTLLREM